MADFITAVSSVSELTTWYTSTVPGTIPSGDRYIAELAGGAYELTGVSWVGKTLASAGQLIVRAASTAKPNVPGTAARPKPAGTSSAVITHSYGANNAFGSSIADGFVFEDIGFQTVTNGVFLFNAGTFVRRCVLYRAHLNAYFSFNGTGRASNCLGVSSVAGTVASFNGPANLTSNTFIGFVDGAVVALQGSFQNSIWRNNVAINLGGSTDPWPTPPTSFFSSSSSNNATSLSSAGNCPGTSPILNAVAASLAVTSSAGALDARPVTGSVLLAAGVVSSLNEGTDWYGASRSGTTPTIGAVEAAYVPDTTPPTLTSPTGTSTGATTASGTVSTNEAGGTLYRLASTNATELAATVKAAALTSAVSAAGTQTVGFTGLTPSTTYYAHYVHTDAAGNDSAHVGSASFTTAAASDTASPTMTGTVSVTPGSNTASAMCPTASDNVSVTAYEASLNNGATWPFTSATPTISITGLTPSTPYTNVQFRAKDAAGNTSTPVLLATFTTTAAPATATTLSGPSSGSVGSASTNFTVGANGAITGTVTVTPSDGGNGGTFSPTSVNISNGTPTAAFTYTAGSSGTKTISISDNGSLTDAAPLSYSATTTPGRLLFTNNPADICREFGSGSPITSRSATMWVHNSTTGVLVAQISVSTDSAGLFGTISSGLMTLSTTYRLDWKFSSGEYGSVYRTTETT